MMHSKISPSGASRWMACMMSANVSEDNIYTPVEEDNPIAVEGTRLHDVAEKLLERESSAFSGVEDVVVDYVKYVRNLAESSTIHIETKVTFKYLMDFRGYVDAWIFKDGVLHVIDLKTGFIPVSAYKNPQLQLYALGIYNDLIAMDYKIESICLHIHQSSVGNVSNWEMSVGDLIDFESVLIESLRVTDSVETGEHCKYCPVRFNCKNRHNELQAVYSENLVTTVDMIENYATVLAREKEILGYLADAKQALLDVMKSGQEVEGFKLVNSITRTRFFNKTEVAESLLKAGYEDAIKVSPKSWTELKKILPVDVLDKLEDDRFKPKTTPVLVAVSDRRKALSLEQL